MSAARAIGSSVVAMLLPGVALACSGPGAMDKILRAERIGWLLLFLTGALALWAALMFRRWQVPWRRTLLVALPALVHPGWWLSARGGDCGAMRLLGSIGVTAMTVVALGLAVGITALRRPT